MRLLFLFILSLYSAAVMGQNKELATLGGGCFWCTEAVFLELTGVLDVKPGYSGGHVKNPTYKEVCAETTGHAEVIQITYDANLIRFSQILEVFFMTHDPTTLNRQGNDVGTQYRSAIFYHSKQQKEIAAQIIQLFEEEAVYKSPIVTELTEFDVFYPAEDYHINYYNRNKNQGYCSYVITPKLDKFRTVFKELLKEN